MLSRSFLAFAAAAALAPAARAGLAELSFPLDPTAEAAPIEGVVLRPSAERIAALEALDRVVLRGVALPGGVSVDLELERLSVERRKFGFHVDGRPAPGLADGLGLSVWKGVVSGDAGSEVMLSFSNHGSRGWIATGGDLVHLMPRAGAGGDWTRGDAVLARDESVVRAGAAFDLDCQAKRPGVGPEESLRVPRTAVAPTAPLGGTQALGSCSLRECRIALEGDWQLFQQFASLPAETAYITSILTWASDRYEAQASTALTFPYLNLWSTSNDGWAAQDSGGGCVDVLNELQATWVGAIPANADLGHLMSGANLGCGVAWLDVLCDDQFNFSVSGNMNGDTPFPIAVGPSNWDFMVFTHEVGHNFDALHTHDYCPPLDQCAPSGYFGQCQTSQVCTNQGTIMSYCHLCSGGTNNITTFFHPTSAADMTAAAQTCLPAFVSIDGTTPTLVAPNVATPVTATIAGTPTGNVELWWRPSGVGPFSAIAMTSQGGGTYAASLPAVGCGSTPQFYYSFVDAACGAATDPANAPASFHSALVGTQSVTFSDNFQSDTGWTTAGNASSGLWQRGVPVNDSGWQYDPASDWDGSGSCWLTGNTAGNTDVDGGSAVLTSPAFSLAGGPALVTYAYFLRLTEPTGTDFLLVEASTSGTGGPWVEVARHQTDGGLAWRTHAIDAAAFATAGVTPGANMRLRFTATDGNPPSIVEAAVDGFVASVLACNAIGTNYCSPASNSTGQPALLSASGSNSVAANNLAFQAQPVTTTTSGVLFYGNSQTFTPLGNGFRCVAGSLLRGPVALTTNGVLSFAFNNAVPPAAGNVVAGSTWNFQAWYRDVPAGGALFNLSDGYTITFVP